MDINLNQICDVCGRAGRIATAEQVGPYTICICHACRFQGVTSAQPVAQGYESVEDQTRKKHRLHDEFTRLPQPGRYPVTISPRLRLPPVCCGCLGRPTGTLPLKPGGIRKPGSPPAVLIVVIVFMVFGCLLTMGRSVIQAPLMIGFVIMAVVAAVRWGNRPEATVFAPVCGDCLRNSVPGQPAAEILSANSPDSVTVCFSNWEYAELVKHSAGPKLPDNI